jgi:hypothetical protein
MHPTPLYNNIKFDKYKMVPPKQVELNVPWSSSSFLEPLLADDNSYTDHKNNLSQSSIPGVVPIVITNESSQINSSRGNN